MYVREKDSETPFFLNIEIAAKPRGRPVERNLQ